jgi:hypothetical protein
LLSKIDQLHIDVDVDFYNETEKEKLLNYQTSDEIRRIVESPVSIPVSEFLTYYLFHKKRPAKSGWQNYREISSKVDRAFSEIEDFIDFNGQSIATAPDVGEQVKSITENIGESIGISVVNRIHSLTEADWGKIPEKGGRNAPRVFDYQYDQVASDAEMIIQVETKGSSVNNNLVKADTIRHHKSDIVNT